MFDDARRSGAKKKFLLLIRCYRLRPRIQADLPLHKRTFGLFIIPAGFLSIVRAILITCEKPFYQLNYSD